MDGVCAGSFAETVRRIRDRAPQTRQNFRPKIWDLRPET